MNTPNDRHNNTRPIAASLAAAGIAALAGSSIVMAAGTGAPANPHAHPAQHSPPHQWMQPDTRDRDQDRDKDRGKDDKNDGYNDRERSTDGKASPPPEAKYIDMRRATTAREVLGTEIVSSTTGDTIGTVADLIISVTSGDIKWLILDPESMFEDVVAVSMDEVSWHLADARFTTTITEARLNIMPKFDTESWPTLRHETWFGALETFVTGDERDTLGSIRYVRAKDILDQPLLANLVVPEDPNVDTKIDEDGTDIERNHVADVHDIVLAMDIERAPVLIARTDEFMEEPVHRLVPINAVRWSQRDPILMNVTESVYKSIVRVPETFPQGAMRPTDIVHAFRSFKVPALIRETVETPTTPGPNERPTERPQR